MSGLSILQIAHDHPDWTPGGTEIVAHDLARALDARADSSCRLLVAATALQRPGGEAGRLGAHGDDIVLHTGAYDRFSMARIDGHAWVEAVGRVLDTLRPDVVHLHGLDRIGAEIVPAIRRFAPLLPDRTDAARLPADLSERRSPADDRRGRPLSRRAA